MRVIAGWLALALLLPAAGPEPLTVSAAISLSDVLEDVAAAWRGAGGGPVTYNFAASNVLARQIVHGAPVDLFVSADDAQMDVVEGAGLIAAGTRVRVAGNRLVVVAGPSAPGLRSVGDLQSASIRRVAIGDPAGVPAGVYARQYLEHLGIWSSLEDRIVPARSVRAALTAVQNGSADAAFVYATDARIAPALRVALVVSGPGAPRIAYPAAIVGTTRQRAAAGRFLAFLQSASAQSIFERHGFVPVDTPR